MPHSTATVRPIYLLLAWLLLNLTQAALTPLDPDETYYWMYAGQLDWGYFDHPPAVAVLIALGRDWLPGPFGLRFGHVLAGCATLTGLYYLLDKPKGKSLWTLAALAAAQPMLEVYGFIATPDGPLLLFTTLYLLAYRRFLQRPGYLLGAVWGLTMAALLYSKYHGLVLILFSVLPNLGYLIRSPAAWVAVVTGVALFFPHLYWQYSHDYPSFRYHLSGRDDPYQFKYTLQYIINQLLIFSPFLLYHYVRTFTGDHARDRFERSLRWLVAAILVFFLYTTTKGRTEAQWTALLSIPLIYLTYRAVQRFPSWRYLLVRLCWLTVGILMVARLLLMAPRTWLPFEKPFDHQPWVERLQEIAGDTPVIVENSYRFASLYEFYTGGKPAWTFTDVAYRPSQYDIWQRDTLYHDHPVYLLGQANWNYPNLDTFLTQKGSMRLRRIDSFQLVTDVRLDLELPATSSDELRVYATAPRNIDLAGSLPIRLFLTNRLPSGDYEYEQLTGIKVNYLRAGAPTLLYAGRPAGKIMNFDGVKELSVGLAYRGMPPLRDQSPTIEME